MKRPAPVPLTKAPPDSLGTCLMAPGGAQFTAGAWMRVQGSKLSLLICVPWGLITQIQTRTRGPRPGGAHGHVHCGFQGPIPSRSFCPLL